MNAEILSVGTELLLGELIDTNAQYIAVRLPALGIDCYGMHQVGDNEQRLEAALRGALARADLVIMTGGLGPTEDDVTREAIAATFGEPLSPDPALEEALRARFAGRNIPLVERNFKQALRIPSARAIPNPRGTAPGWWVERDGKIVVAMPGVPSEMYLMWEEQVATELARHPTGATILSRTLKTNGLGESILDEMISPLLKSTNPSIGVYAKRDGVHVRATAKAPTIEACRALIEPMEAALRQILGDAVWGTDDETLATVAGRLLKERGLTVATMESCTGGLLAAAFTEAEGSSAYFRGGLVTYATDVKALEGVDPVLIEQHGVISDAVAADMARAARERFGADIGIGVTGVAGPAEQEGKPPGTVHIGIDVGGTGRAEPYRMPQGRQMVQQRAVMTALFQLRRRLLQA
ncbi:MAG: competence/damage-inducible protein A [Dehalococcoidia bacterium]|nr:competence/damage-inducible protein A [Dehalococcoidia bacterium]